MNFNSKTLETLSKYGYFGKKKSTVRWKYLCIIILVFIIGTSIDIFCKIVFGFAVGGLGGVFGALVAVALMYRYKQEKFSWHSLLKLFKLGKPQLLTVYDRAEQLLPVFLLL